MTCARSRRLARWALVAVLAFTVLFPVFYAITVPEQLGAAATLPNVPDGTYRVYVVDWGYHTAIVVPQPTGWTLGPPGKEQAPLLEYAWGDRRSTWNRTTGPTRCTRHSSCRPRRSCTSTAVMPRRRSRVLVRSTLVTSTPPRFALCWLSSSARFATRPTANECLRIPVRQDTREDSSLPTAGTYGRATVTGGPSSGFARRVSRTVAREWCSRDRSEAGCADSVPDQRPHGPRHVRRLAAAQTIDP
jgi:hypothetical protein